MKTRNSPRPSQARTKWLTKIAMTTRCAGPCGRVLTTERGERVLSANFDSSLPTPAYTPTVTYAWCDTCYGEASISRA